jgi:uncharacterized protein (TIGR03032 family)
MTANGSANGKPTESLTEHFLDFQRRDIRCTHSENLPQILSELNLSLLLSTYQTGHLVVVAARQGQLVVAFHMFDRAMGVAVKPGCIAVCARKEVWFLRSVPDLTAQLQPAGHYDACFLARTAHFTGDIRTHDAAWVGHEFWVVNTRFSCLAALHPYHSFENRWMPPFVSALVPEDRCHLNGLAIEHGRPCYVTAFAPTDSPAGWRPIMANSGCLLEVPSGRTVAGGLSLPHSPRVHDDRLFLLQSGTGTLDAVDPANGQVQRIAEVPGVARGLAFQGDYAFVGLSKPRPTLEGVPIVAPERRGQLKCGVVVIDLRSGSQVGHLYFTTELEEVYDLQVLPGITFPFISGPWAERDTGQPLWTVPAGSCRIAAGAGATARS